MPVACFTHETALAGLMASGYRNSLTAMFILKEENTALQLLNERVKMFAPEASKYESMRYVRNQHEIEKRKEKTNVN
jgi:hypothetical protein